MKSIYTLILALVIFASCNQNPQQQPQANQVTGPLSYTINDTLNITSQGVYYFILPSVPCAQGGFVVSQPNELNRSLNIITFSDNYSAGTLLKDSTNPACTFTKSLKIGVYETPNKLYMPYQLVNFKSWLKITQNANGLISGDFHIKAMRDLNMYPGDTINVVGTFTDFNIMTQ